ncbi:hypothetical protein WJX74_003082 [Apatococcus lobatus]|uniref:General transcription factor IIH subunit n=1 Tax=Apatococcus lobatus TaxID=904363 RepID=A0AAW1QJP1_9CHLO
MEEAGPSQPRGWDQQDPEALIDDQDPQGEEAADLSAFQREYEDDHSWEQLQEDEHGHLRAIDMREEQRAKRKRLLSAAMSARIRRGMIRYLQVVVDLSRAASIQDMRPNRAAAMASVLVSFIREFFDQNPLSHLGIIIMRNGRSERLSELSASPEFHINKLRSNLDAGGDASLMNGLDMAVDSLKAIPSYGHREVLVLFAALSTCDPGNIQDSVKSAQQHKCRVSCIGLAAEVHICRLSAQETGGTYGVALGEKHMEELVMGHAPPPPSRAADSAASLVRMGFPQRRPEGSDSMALIGKECTLLSGGFTCPRCLALVPELPSSCHVCGLTLVSSPHLARSYHHLFPIKPFVEVSADAVTQAMAAPNTQQRLQANDSSIWCYSCSSNLIQPDEADNTEAGVVVRCPDCGLFFCYDCDSYIHESLHNCPGCEAVGTEERFDDAVKMVE